MHPTPLRVVKIVAILSVIISKNAFSIYQCGAGDGHTVRLLGKLAGKPFLVWCLASSQDAPYAGARCVGARCAGVVRAPVVLTARCAACDSGARGADCPSC